MPERRTRDAQDPRTAPDDADAVARVCVTHPFHPLCGKNLELVDRERRSTGEVMLVRDERGQVRKLSAAWTNAAPVDAFVLVARERARVRPEDLDALAAMIEAIVAARESLK